MSQIELKTSDGATIGAYVAEPTGKPRGGIVVLQEIFGVNSHIRSVVDGYAADGYLAIAPALFDRTQKNVELGYVGDDMTKAREFMGKLKPEQAMQDIDAAIKYVAKAGKVGIVGYCLGGRLSWQAAAELSGLSAAVTYYGGGMPSMAGLKARVPVLSHFGAADTHIPLDTVEAFRKAQPDVKVEVYEGAEHGFNCDQRASFSPAAAKLARERTLAFFRTHVG